MNQVEIQVAVGVGVKKRQTGPESFRKVIATEAAMGMVKAHAGKIRHIGKWKLPGSVGAVGIHRGPATTENANAEEERDGNKTFHGQRKIAVDSDKIQRFQAPDESIRYMMRRCFLT